MQLKHITQFSASTLFAFALIAPPLHAASHIPQDTHISCDSEIRYSGARPSRERTAPTGHSVLQ